MKIQVVGMPSDPVHEFSGADEMIAMAPTLGWTLIGYEERPHLSPALIGLPTFKELHGPAGDGDSVRYETWAANHLYSS